MKNNLDIFIVVILLSFANVSARAKLKKSEDDTEESKDDLVEINEDTEDEDLDVSIKDNNYTLDCNRIPSNLLHAIRTASYQQFPFMAVILSSLNKYLCSGVIISNGLILTTARCAAGYQISVLLNATRGKIDNNTIVVQVNKTEMFPNFIGFRSLLNIGLIYTEPYNCTICTKIRLCNHTYKSIYDVKGLEAVGYGLNTGTDKPKAMQFIGMELKQPLDDLENITASFGCVDTKVPTCFKDTGSAVILENELIGIVDVGEKQCTKRMYATTPSKILAYIVPSYTFREWVDERIKNNEEAWVNASLASYPDKVDAMSE